MKFFIDPPFILGSKVLIWTCTLSLFLPLLVFCYSVFLFDQERSLCEKMGILEKKVKTLVELKSKQESFVREFGESSYLFLEKNIESIQLLKEDSEFLSNILKESSYEPIKTRLDFLTGQENKIHFIKGETKTSNYYEETNWKLEHCVEVCTKDLVQIISLTEGVKLGHFLPNSLRPQLIIKKFSLKMKGDDVDKIFYLDFDILQRNLHGKN